LYCVLANAFFYFDDPNFPVFQGDSLWYPVLSLAVVYGLFGALAWSQRRDSAGAGVVLMACWLAAALLLLGRGRDWYGSLTIPNYYNQSLRLGGMVGAVGQGACLVAAAVCVLTWKVGLWVFSRRRATA
jgi:hypothetical protein